METVNTCDRAIKCIQNLIRNNCFEENVKMVTIELNTLDTPSNDPYIMSLVNGYKDCHVINTCFKHSYIGIFGTQHNATFVKIYTNINVLLIINSIRGYGTYCCKDHATNSMVDMMNRCLECNFYYGNSKYSDHCVQCYKFKFPNKPVTCNILMKERIVFEKLLGKIKNLSDVNIDDVALNKSIQKGTSRRRPDFMYELDTHWICIENDEHRHSGYEEICENKRMCELYQDNSYKNMVILRFNCDNFKKHGVEHPGLFNVNRGIITITNNNTLEERILVLFERFLFHLENVPEKAITTEYLFYSE